ncbi:MAG: ATP-binding cassette domain-containing protein, partial [Caldilineaceae bacterium]|nr:ATP-binding cassette domain-containing protein [Caldilineaceae bacterium]
MRTSASYPAHQGNIALQLQNITVRYGPVTALQEISVTVKRGDQIALIGPNGAGKSTL